MAVNVLRGLFRWTVKSMKRYWRL